MPERVMFTRKSADRIAKVVKQVEGTPVSEPVQQRRRAGGYRMESLWEVTEVQTTEKTVTLKRVQDTDDNLNDRSETLEVAYDPDNVPAVEDRGMIIRLGDGTRFFFKRAALVQNRVIVNQFAYVDKNNPNSNYGFPVFALFADKYPGTGAALSEFRPVYKFASQLPEIETEDMNKALISLSELDGPIIFGRTSSGTPGKRDYRFDVVAIREDFSASSMTWNILQGLTTTTISVVANMVVYYLSNKQFPNDGMFFDYGFIFSKDGIMEMFDPDFGEPAYGFYIDGNWSSGQDGDSIRFGTRRRDFTPGQEKYSAWAEWY